MCLRDLLINGCLGKNVYEGDTQSEWEGLCKLLAVTRPHGVIAALDPDICMTMGTLADILSVLRRERARLFAKYGLKSMAVFGSATRDDFTPESDVDILVEFEPNAEFDYFDLCLDLEEMIKRKVDVVMRTAVKPHYMPFIEKDLKYV